MTAYKYISSRMTEEAALRQIAEEAAELAQAALKYLRTRKQDSPTPTTPAEALTNLLEEIGDVQVSLNVWLEGYDKSAVLAIVNSFEKGKKERWAVRLREAENKTKEGEENAEENKQQAEGREI
jgi:NTP pyrophosphatase (non-canonical NTP hydrolase)